MGKDSTLLKKDKYKSARGGYSRLFDICCRQCGSIILLYQKDGPGNLRRLYIDRILEPNELSKFQTLNIKDIPVLKCNKCNGLLGTPYIYKKEKRKAFRVRRDSVIKRLHRKI
jgi:hypothetical protein